MKYNLLFPFLLILALSNCCPGFKSVYDREREPDKTDFDLAQWRSLIKKDMEHMEEKRLCAKDKRSFENIINYIDELYPVCSTKDIELAKLKVGSPGNATICLISLQAQGEIYQEYAGVFWIKGKVCRGITWKAGKPQVFTRPASDYCKLKRMSTICRSHITNYGTNMIFTEINGSDMWVKTIVNPSLKQEIKFHDFLRD